MKQHNIRKNKLSNFNGFWVCFVKLPMRVEMGRLVKKQNSPYRLLIPHFLLDGCFLICDPWNIFLDHLFSFWKIVRSIATFWAIYKFENGLIYWNLEPNKFTNPHVKDYWPENTLYVAVDDAGFSISSSSLVFSFGKLGRPRGMTLGTGLLCCIYSLLFSFLVSLTKSPNQKQSQLHEFRSKLSILYITLIHLNWHKIILQTKYSITCILTLYRK
ncbi:hypothetical protein ACJX0J_009788 [Zea mays]